MKLHNLAAVSGCGNLVAAVISLGSVSCLSGATLALAMTKDVSLSTHKKATAPYALGLASAKMCSLLHCIVAPPLGKYCLVIFTHIASWISCAISNHSCWSSSVSGSSHSMLRCHKVCIKILALIVTGDSSPSGSNTLDDSLSTSCFVTKVVTVGIGVALRMRACTFIPCTYVI